MMFLPQARQQDHTRGLFSCNITQGFIIFLKEFLKEFLCNSNHSLLKNLSSHPACHFSLQILTCHALPDPHLPVVLQVITVVLKHYFP